jgi:hypothetical protein
MKNFSSTFIYLITTFLVACGGSSGGSSDGDGGNNTANKTQPKNRVNWSAVSSEFNPRVEDVEFRTDGYEKINVDAFGFKDDVEVVYSNEVPPGYGYLRLYKVWKEQASWGDLRPRPNGTTLNLKNYGSYQCSIRITNGQIVELKGGCYVRLQVFMAPGAEIEVYNVGQLITKRFIPISTDEFLEQLDDATWADDKFAAIENFLASYIGMSKKPTLTAHQLGIVVSEFNWKEEKYKSLTRLHTVVSDRENLGKMIDDRFGHFEREEARRIVGL